MTIGVAAFGDHAGAAVYEAVLGAELLGRGAIGGFAVMAVLDAAGAVQYRVTQRGGVSALDLPAGWRDARVAAIISSGPDRPEPLTQFLAGADGVGLVTGHRLPNLPGVDGVALNRAAVDRLAGSRADQASRGQASQGRSPWGQASQAPTPQQAVDAVLQSHAEWDAGLVAIDVHGRLGMANSARVSRRDDLGEFSRVTPTASLGLLHNSIYARGDLAAQLGELAWSRLQGNDTDPRFITLRHAVPLMPAARDCVHVDAQGAIVAIDTANPRLAALDRISTAVYLKTDVRRDGVLLGVTATELYVRIHAGAACPVDLPAQNTLLLAGRSSDVAA
ncbi:MULTISPECIES: hypothetical protein [unclassified Achromobacter]|uniref:DUF6963 family protein n=1 Tax=unclassified Achromobacter TaxID=2626865 RepID=UPI000B51E105|nr:MULTISPECIES: hypothetical protein [unclassified Achromobacter]OWT71553.1 hypothetical protein CEY05_25545 [Achromobacter sp. HZ34]OWT73210.1 hypothetical protein CEY04_24380 [Achromobacter sp. HZ28]